MKCSILSIIRWSLIIVASVFLLLAPAFPIEADSSTTGMSLLTNPLFTSLAVLIGIVFIAYKKNRILEYIGYALIGGVAVVALLDFILIARYTPRYGTGAIFFLVGFICYALALIVWSLQRFLLKQDNGSDIDAKVAEIRDWKKLLDEGIITPEIYEDKKNQIIGLNASKDKKPADSKK